jgi:cytidine deaminase
MAISERTIVIGLTAPFGSGCSTSAGLLRDHLGYYPFTLSTVIRQQWEKLHPRSKPTRANLQALGNDVRRDTKDPGQIAHLAVEYLTSLKDDFDRIVLDGIRNVGEVETLRHRFGRDFYLIALECPASERLERLRGVYGHGDEALDKFRVDNEQDRDQEDAFGQQVELCVDAADVLIVNDGEVTLKKLREKLVEYVRVLTGDAPRYARPEEILMNLAFSASHGSKCLKRQVGAVLVAAGPLESGDVVGQGFNENPTRTLPCVDEPNYGADAKKGMPGRCHRDIVRHETYTSLAKQRARCPNCGERLRTPASEEPPWLCSSCNRNLDMYFWPERAMTLCTAVHAEVAAMIAAGPRARGTSLYTTTHPCFQCAEKLIQAGIRWVIFTEPYPDIRAAGRLELAGIKVRRFEGVRSGRFDEIFSRARPYVARQRNVSRTGPEKRPQR